jgi:hypothetical protein
MPLKAKFHGNYRKSTTVNGVPTVLTVFRYTVDGSEKELQQYEEIQGDNFKIEDKTGKPLYFTTRYVADNVELVISENSDGDKRIVVDDSEYAKLQSIIDTYGESVARLMMMKGM